MAAFARFAVKKPFCSAAMNDSVKRRILFIPAVLIAFGVLIALAYLAPLPVPDLLDFLVLNTVTTAIRYGVSPYDSNGIQALIAQLNNLPVEKIFIPAFAYPPWYALIFLFFAWMPLAVGARLWFFFNLIMIGVSAWILPEDWVWQKRALAVFAAVLFLPALGLLIVGQYGAPVLLGTALCIHAFRKQDAALAATGLLLLTFKPHLGVLIFFAVVLSLWARRDSFGRRALAFAAVGLIFLFALGFLADGAWPISYFRALTEFRSLGDVASCDLCTSLSLSIAEAITGAPEMALASGVSLILLIGAGLWIGFTRRSVLQNPPALIAFACVLTVLISPYMMNYDYVVLLAPLSLIVSSARKRDWLAAGTIYLIPWLALAAGRELQDGVLLAAALLLFWRVSLTVSAA